MLGWVMVFAKVSYANPKQCRRGSRPWRTPPQLVLSGQVARRSQIFPKQLRSGQRSKCEDKPECVLHQLNRKGVRRGLPARRCRRVRVRHRNLRRRARSCESHLAGRPMGVGRRLSVARARVAKLSDECACDSRCGRRSSAQQTIAITWLNNRPRRLATKPAKKKLCHTSSC